MRRSSPRVTLFNDNLTAAGFSPLSFATPAGWEAAAQLDGMITLQAAMIAYLDDFKLMFLITLCAAPLLLLLRYRPAPPSGGATGRRRGRLEPGFDGAPRASKSAIAVSVAA